MIDDLHRVTQYIAIARGMISFLIRLESIQDFSIHKSLGSVGRDSNGMTDLES